MDLGEDQGKSTRTEWFFTKLCTCPDDVFVGRYVVLVLSFLVWFLTHGVSFGLYVSGSILILHSPLGPKTSNFDAHNRGITFRFRDSRRLTVGHSSELLPLVTQGTSQRSHGDHRWVLRPRSRRRHTHYMDLKPRVGPNVQSTALPLISRRSSTKFRG